MDLFDLPHMDDFNTYPHELPTSASDWSTSSHSNFNSPLEASSTDYFSLCSQAEGLPGSRISFDDATQALKMEKETRRKNQNRSAQRAYRERQQKLFKELQKTIDGLTSDRDNLRNQVKALENDIHRQQAQISIQQMHLHRKNASPYRRPHRVPEVAKRLGDNDGNDGVGWMLKHMYGLGEADEDLFTVFEINKSNGS